MNTQEMGVGLAIHTVMPQKTARPVRSNRSNPHTQILFSKSKGVSGKSVDAPFSHTHPSHPPAILPSHPSRHTLTLSHVIMAATHHPTALMTAVLRAAASPADGALLSEGLRACSALTRALEARLPDDDAHLEALSYATTADEVPPRFRRLLAADRALAALSPHRMSPPTYDLHEHDDPDAVAQPREEYTVARCESRAALLAFRQAACVEGRVACATLLAEAGACTAAFLDALASLTRFQLCTLTADPPTAEHALGQLAKDDRYPRSPSSACCWTCLRTATRSRPCWRSSRVHTGRSCCSSTA
jgi:hypothetical protein